MKIRKTIVIVFAVMCLLAGTAFATSERSMTPPADYDEMADGYFNIRHLIGYGDIENDPMAHGLTVYNASSTSTSATPELGDSSVVSTAALAGLCVAALAGATIADKKRREMAK